MKRHEKQVELISSLIIHNLKISLNRNLTL